MRMHAWADERSRALTIWDVAALKVTSLLFGMVVGAFMASFVLEHLWWFVIPMLVLGGRGGYRWLTADEESSPGR